MLFFFAGYEIDFERIKGRPLELGAVGWGSRSRSPTGSAARSPAAGVVLSFLYTGSAMATTAIGTLIPILSDNGEMKTTLRHLPARRGRRSASSARSCW